jgi:small subunit ribosomal protein S7
VPSEVPEARRVALAIRWLKGAARQRRDKSMAQRLANELTAAANGEGTAIKKRDDMHRMAEANKAFQHFKW